MRSLSQFQALQEGEQELVSLRELGLTDAEIQLWLKRDTPEQEEKVRGVVEGACLITRSDKYYRFKFISYCCREYLHTSRHWSAPSAVMCCGCVGLVCVKSFLNVCVCVQPQGVRAAPGVKQQRLQAIRDKIAARAELLSRPQRFATSQPLSRREMEIEQALFQGQDRLGFLTALYHRGLEFLYVNIL